MVGKRAENVIEIRAYIKGRSLLGLKPVDIHREVCDIYGKGQMSYMTICRWVARFKSGHQQLKDLLTQVALQLQQQNITLN